MELKQLREEIKKIIAEETRYNKTYLAKIIDVDDPLERGRVKCYIMDLYWIDGESAIWVEPAFIRQSLKLKVDDFVIIGFKTGDPRRPYYFGMSQELKEMYPSGYDGTKQVLFESNEGDFFVTYDDNSKELIVTIGDNIYTIDQNGIIAEDINGNKIEMTATGIKWTDANSNTMEMKASGIDMLGATESFLLGDTWKTNWTTFNTAVQTATSGTTAQNAAGIVTIKAAFATFFAQITNMLSTKIKGE